MFTADCTSSFTSADLVYFLEVSCSADFIYVFGNSKFTFPKKSVALILVSVDILIVLILFSLISFQGWNEARVCKEFEETELSSSRYTVEIRNMPQEGGDAKFKSEMW
jgi:hypothetical protein